MDTLGAGAGVALCDTLGDSNEASANPIAPRLGDASYTAFVLRPPARAELEAGRTDLFEFLRCVDTPLACPAGAHPDLVRALCDVVGQPVFVSGDDNTLGAHKRALDTTVRRLLAMFGKHSEVSPRDEMRARLRGFRLWVRSVAPALTASEAWLRNADVAKTPEAPVDIFARMWYNLLWLFGAAPPAPSQPLQLELLDYPQFIRDLAMYCDDVTALLARTMPFQHEIEQYVNADAEAADISMTAADAND